MLEELGYMCTADTAADTIVAANLEESLMNHLHQEYISQVSDIKIGSAHLS